jgi:hypothetical protein
MGAHSPQKKKISGLVTKIMKAPDAPAGPADSRTGLVFLLTSQGVNCRGGKLVLKSYNSSKSSKVYYEPRERGASAGSLLNE